MKAIILASGAGKRLRPFVDCVPKPMIKIGDKTILDYQLEGLINYGIDNFIITTGPFKEKLEEHVRSNYRLKVRFVHNHKYEITNYIFTLWLTRNLIDSNVLLIHGDLLFDNVLIGKLIEAKGNRVLINRKIKPSEKDFNALIERNRVTKIGVALAGPNAYFCAPMYQFSKLDFLLWLNKIDDFIKQGRTNCYAEDAFNEISKEIVLRPLYYDEFCMEIDTMDDFENAKSYLLNKR